MSSDRSLDDLVNRLRAAERLVASAYDDFMRLRNVVDSAGELALWERLDSAQRALQEVIRGLDEIVYPLNEASGG